MGFIIKINGVAIIEMPCTAGFPVIWAQLLTRQNISGEYYLLLLLTYVLVYLIDELILFFLLVYSLQGRFLQESHGRGLKLVSGLIMSFIALSLNLPACAVGVELTIIKAAY